uniref:Ferric-chelate reductase 1a n=1 Tax=Amphiprion ocellaris TaxID=80972 RepID=A0AAQ5Y5H7_AMPOC
MSPVGLCFLFFFSVLVCHWEPVCCYANGKVTKACGSMKPHHGGASGQTTLSPYQLQTNTSTFSPGDQIRVILSGTSYFEGFLLQARDAAQPESASAIGSFTLTNPDRMQLLTCNNHQGSAVSQTSDARQTEVVVIWTAPQDSPNEVQFFVTVVAHYKVFWLKVPGPIIYQHGITPHPHQTTSTHPTIQPTTPSILPGPFTSEGCGQSKSCLLDPPGCDPEKDPHYHLLHHHHFSLQSVMFELSGPAEGYVSFALSWDTWMGNDDVYLCIKDEDRVSVSAAFVSGRTYPEDHSQSGLSSVSWRLADGSIQCRFSRPVKLTNQGRFDLDQGYFLFLASGHTQYGEIRKHSRQPLISRDRKLITGPPQVLRGSRSPTIMKMHGALMLLAWMLTGSVGTFIASFYKPDWPNQTLFGQKVWFQVHRGLMMLTVILTVVAFCLPFIYRKGWSTDAGVHPHLGCCVLVLSLIQPIAAMHRPPPDSNRRFIFNWTHSSIGIFTEILAVATMLLGVGQTSLPLPSPWATSVLIGYVVWVASLKVALGWHSRYRKSLGSGDQQAILPEQIQQSHWVGTHTSNLHPAKILFCFKL